MMAYDPHTPYLSYTGFTKYEFCPFHYYVEYIEKDRPEVQDSRNSFTGSALHNLLEDYLIEQPESSEWLINNAREYWERQIDKEDFISWRHENDRDELWAKMEKWTRNLRNLLERNNIKPGPWKPEFKADSYLNLSGKRVKVGGRIDLMKELPDGGVVFFDLKASENRSIMKLDQIVWYSILLGVYFDDMEMPITGGYLLPGFNEIKLYNITEERKLELLNRMNNAFDGIINKNWEPNLDRNSCFFCNIPHKCPVVNRNMPSQQTGILKLGE